MSKEQVLERVSPKLDHLQRIYPNSEKLLRDSMQEASTWVIPLITSGKIPTPEQLERLATQLLAIVVASEK